MIVTTEDGSSAAASTYLLWLRCVPLSHPPTVLCELFRVGYGGVFAGFGVEGDDTFDRFIE